MLTAGYDLFDVDGAPASGLGQMVLHFCQIHRGFILSVRFPGLAGHMHAGLFVRPWADVCSCSYCFVDLCSFVLSIVSSRLLNAAIEKDYDNKGVVVAIILSHVEMAAAARFCDYLLIIFIFVSLITMGNGIIHSRTGSPGKNSKTIKRSADAISVLIGAICAAQWGLRIRVFLDLYLENYRVKHGSADMANLLNIARQLDFATLLIGLLCSLATMVRAVMIYLPTRADKQIYWVCRCSRKYSGVLRTWLTL